MQEKLNPIKKKKVLPSFRLPGKKSKNNLFLSYLNKPYNGTD